VTALLKAVKDDDRPTAELLLGAGANPNVRDKYDVTPLHWAVHNGDEQLVAALLAHGANANTVAQIVFGGVQRPTPLGRAVHGHNLAIAAQLIDAPSAQRAVVGGPEVEEAVETGQAQMVATLLGATPERLALRPAMVVAVSRGETDLVERLLDAGAEADAFNATGRTSLMLAARNNDTRTMQVLIDAGATVDGPDHYGRTALHHAIRANALDAARLLLDVGADPTLRAANGRTPLEEAKKSRQAEIGKLLAVTRPESLP
jgi:ankyrin repeat protein